MPGRRNFVLNNPILVTGGAGFIGSHLAEEWVRRGRAVRVLDNLSTGRRSNLARLLHEDAVDLCIGDVRDPQVLAEAMEGCDTVFHLAASVGVGKVTAEPLLSLRNNLDGVQSLFDAVHKQPVSPRVIFFSTSEVYGKSEEVPLSEDSTCCIGPTLVPRWSYAAGKIVGEYQALFEAEENEVPVTVVRCFNTAGPRQISDYGMVIPRFVEQARAGSPLTVYGDGSQMRCFSYVGDVVDCVIRLAQNSDTVGKVFNVGSDQEISVLNLAEEIIRLSGSSSSIQFVPYEDVFGERFQETRRRVPDLSALEEALGSVPRTELSELLERTLLTESETSIAGSNWIPHPGTPETWNADSGS